MNTENSTSQSTMEIAKALAAAQGEMSGAKKGSANPFFSSRYADLAAVIGAIREPLAKHGLAHVQIPGGDEGGMYLETLILHSSGEWIRGRIHMNPPDVFHKESREWVSGDTPQGRGSVISYMRRYALQAMCGLEAEDDDGEKGMRRDSDPRPKALPKTTPLPAHSYQQASLVNDPQKGTAPVDGRQPDLIEGLKGWRNVKVHIGTPGGKVHGRELGTLAGPSLDWIQKQLIKITAPTKEDSLLIAAMAMREAELNPVGKNLELLKSKCQERNVPLAGIVAVNKELGSKADAFPSITDEEAKYLLDTWPEVEKKAIEIGDNIPM